MRNPTIVFFFSAFFTALFPTDSSAGWLLYHKPEFKGRVIDAETKAPINGAVVVATYYKSTMGVPHHYSSIINVQETLTDQNGEFSIPSYTTIIQPLSVSSFVHFIIFKPGFGNFPWQQVNPKLGIKEEIYFDVNSGDDSKVASSNKATKETLGIVELPKLITRKERDNALSMPNLPLDSPCHKVRELVTLLRQEYINLGYKDYEHWMEDCK